jgi:tetratricopeptide (TPR) repeat protein
MRPSRGCKPGSPRRATPTPWGERQGCWRRPGRTNEAIEWLQTRASKTGDPLALGHAAVLLERAGRRDEAVRMYQRAANAGDPDALRQAAELLAKAGRIDETIHMYQRRPRRRP